MFAVPDNTLLRPENPALRHPVRVALEVAADRDRWRHLLRYDPEERLATLVSRDEQQEVWLMSWLPGQRTDLHDHAFASGAFTVVSGHLTEAVARRAPPRVRQRRLHRGRRPPDRGRGPPRPGRPRDHRAALAGGRAVAGVRP